MMDPTGLERRIPHDPVPDDLAHGDQPLGSGEPAEEDVETAREAEDVDQDPDRVPNRLQEPEPPHTERVGPWDDDELED